MDRKEKYYTTYLKSEDMSCTKKCTEFETCINGKCEFLPKEENEPCSMNNDCTSKKCTIVDCHALHKAIPNQAGMCKKIGRCAPLEKNTLEKTNNACYMSDSGFYNQPALESTRFTTL